MKLYKKKIFPLFNLFLSVVGIVGIILFFVSFGILSLLKWETMEQFFFTCLLPVGLFFVFLREFFLTIYIFKEKNQRKMRVSEIIFLITFYIGIMLVLAFFASFFFIPDPATGV